MLARTAIAALTVALLLCGVELFARTLGSASDAATRANIASLRAAVLDDEGRARPHPHLGYWRAGRIENGAPIPFVGEPPFDRERPDGVLRVACLGGSTTANAYPLYLRSELMERTGGPVQMLNFGVDAWTSAESLTNYFLNVADWEPDIVVYLHAVNDARPRSVRGFERDYSHYRRPWTGWGLPAWERVLLRHSDAYAAHVLPKFRKWPVYQRVDRFYAEPHLRTRWELQPDTAGSYLRNIRAVLDHVQRRGATAVLMTMPHNPDPSLHTGAGADHSLANLHGLLEHNELLREIATEQGYVLIDLARMSEQRPEALVPQFEDLVHLFDAGQRTEASWIAAAIEDAGVLAR